MHRAPYPPEVYAKLRELIIDEPQKILELGCGPGEISRTLAPKWSGSMRWTLPKRMIEVGQGLHNATILT